jgi:tight adherence protein B
MELLTVTTLIFGLVFILVLTLLNMRGNAADRDQNIAQRMTRPDEVVDVNILRRTEKEKSPFLTMLRRVNLLRKLEESMWQAGIYTRVSDVLLMVVLLFGAGLAGGLAFWHDMWFATASGFGAGALPIVYIRFRRTRRLKAFSGQLPFALDLIKSSLEAGHSFQRALQVLVNEFANPLGGEFRTAMEQNRIGLPIGRALEDMLQRMPIDDLRMLAVAVKVQSDVGSSLAKIVGRLSEIVRIRQRLNMQIKALTAQSRMGGMVVGLLPAIVLGAFSLIQPGYTHSLFYDPTGQKILKLAVGLDLAALFTIRRLLKVDY